MKTGVLNKLSALLAILSFLSQVSCQKTKVAGPESMGSLLGRAKKGDAAAQFNLGLLYDKGYGVPQDSVQAHMWENLAASRKSGDDQKKAAESRDLLAKKMTSQQIAEAQRRAREWKPKSGENEQIKP